MKQSLRELAREYSSQLEASPVTTDRSLLQQGKKILDEQLASTDSDLDPDFVRSGAYLLDRLDEREAVIDLLSRYAKQSLSTEEAAWARWHLAGSLAVARRCAEAVKAQQSLLAWAREHLPQDRLLWVMYDASLASCWVEVGEQWLRIFNELMGSVGPTAENRLDRFYFLRTAAGNVLVSLEMASEGLQIVERIRDLADEDPSWERSFDVRIESYFVEIHIYGTLHHIDEARLVGIRTTELLEERFDGLSQMTLSQKHRLGTLYHNIAGALCGASQYDLAVPLFRRAIELGTATEHTYLWLAASLWTTTKKRPEVLTLLRNGVHLDPKGRLALSEVPEFQDVADDPEFRAAATVPAAAGPA